uniref:BLOC-1-related complex subunit 7 n=1 Tax=Timema tahoe TaxID=61484 RepID=A0A7R9FFF4_9NEOP|nr:unnamed protein product [Timema tahoe]
MLIQTSSADEPMVIFYKCCTGTIEETSNFEIKRWGQFSELTSYKLGSEVPVHDEVKPTGQWHFKMSMCKRLILTKNTNGSVKVQGEVHYICDCGVPGSITKKGKCLSIMKLVQLNNMVPVKRVKLNYVANLIAKHFGANWREREDLAYYSKILMHAARNFALQEHAINNSESNLKKLQLISAHLGYQQESLLKSSLLVEEVKEQFILKPETVSFQPAERKLTSSPSNLLATIFMPSLAGFDFIQEISEMFILEKNLIRRKIKQLPIKHRIDGVSRVNLLSPLDSRACEVCISTLQAYSDGSTLDHVIANATNKWTSRVNVITHIVEILLVYNNLSILTHWDSSESSGSISKQLREAGFNSEASDGQSLAALETLLNEFFAPVTTNERKHDIEDMLNNFSSQQGAWKHCLFFLANSANQYVSMYSLTTIEAMDTHNTGNGAESGELSRAYISNIQRAMATASERVQLTAVKRGDRCG